MEERERLLKPTNQITEAGDKLSQYDSISPIQGHDTVACSLSSIEYVDVVSSDEIKVSKCRWYILLVFSLLCFTQNVIWNTWGPLAQSVNVAYGWGNDVIALLTNWGCITYLISTVLLTWIMDVKGLRWACVITAVLITTGAGLRCIPTPPNLYIWVVHIGQILNGFGGPVVMAAPPLVSAVWFPANQRTTSTSLGTLSNSLGLAVSFIIGPLFVRSFQCPNNTANNTSVRQRRIDATDCIESYNTTQADVSTIQEDIYKLMYIEFAWCAAVLMLTLAYFPSKPLYAPSITASQDRVSFVKGLKQLLRIKAFWLVGICYAVSGGIYDAWASVLDINVGQLLSQVEAGLIGFLGTLLGGCGGLVLSRFADCFARRLKRILLVMYVFGAMASLVFAFSCVGIIPFHKSIIYVTFIIVSIGIDGGSPLFFELVCENTYPVAEGVTTGGITWLNSLFSLVFLLVLMLPVGSMWMNWTAFASIVVCIPILLFYREKYSRLDIDDNESLNDPY